MSSSNIIYIKVWDDALTNNLLFINLMNSEGRHVPLTHEVHYTVLSVDQHTSSQIRPAFKFYLNFG